MYAIFTQPPRDNHVAWRGSTDRPPSSTPAVHGPSRHTVHTVAAAAAAAAAAAVAAAAWPAAAVQSVGFRV